MSSITLIDKNGVSFQIDKKYANYSDFLKSAIEGNEDEDISINVNCDNIDIIIKFFKVYEKYLIDERLDEMEEIEKPLKSGPWKESVHEYFVDFVEENKLTHEDVIMPLLSDVHYLAISPLIEILSSYMASLIRGLPKEEMLIKLKITEEDIEKANAAASLEDQEEEKVEEKVEEKAN